MHTRIRHIVQRTNTFWSEDRSLSVLLAFLVLQIFVVSLLYEERHYAVTFIDGLVCSIFLLAGLITATSHVLARCLLGGLVALATTVRWLNVTGTTPALLIVDPLLFLVIGICFTTAVLRKVYAGGVVTAHRIRGAIAAYLLFGYTFATAYRLIYIIIPDSFSISPVLVAHDQDQASLFIYFSMVTLTTVGYGDITAVHPLAKSLVMLEGVTGTLYPAILLARLVSLQIEYEKK